ncbi:MAG: glycoside hydrolase family 43 protein [Bacteroidaceae bacterium]|nr:glycoside hydrolase family 43 protein [Bacteroidaceae bacterium]
MNRGKLTLLGLLLLLTSGAVAQDKAFEETEAEQAYIFTYFDTKKEAAGLCIAYSYDGYTWTAINDNRPVMHPMVGRDRLLRDPSLCLAPDGTFHLVWTVGWSGQSIGYATSRDLVHWSEQQELPVMKDFPTARNTWAPELFYDKDRKLYYIYWASTVPGAKKVKTEGCLSENDYNHRIYCTTTRDFRRFSKTRLWYNPDFNAIDAAIVRDAQTGDYIMAVKNENLNPAEKNIRIARTRSIKKGFPNEVSAPINSRSDKNGKPYWCEGPAPLYVGNDLVVYYDMYGAHRFGASVSHDRGQTWEDCTDRIRMPAGMSHGTAISVPRSIVDQLRGK